MAIYRCNKCALVKEIGDEYLGKTVACPKCETQNPIRDTVAFISAIIQMVIDQKAELATLRKTPSQKTPNRSDDLHLLAEVDIANTDVLMDQRNVEPIQKWFLGYNAKAAINPSAMNTTGFFDEVALYMGEHFETAGPIWQKIKYIQNKGYETVKIDLGDQTAEQTKATHAFCKKLHEYSFVAKSFHKKSDNSLLLTVQSAQNIKDFFNGKWMEWYALIRLLQFFKEQKTLRSCARSVELEFSDGVKNEIDLFALTNAGAAICVECKTGEFRDDIERLLLLRKRLKMPKTHFVVCVFGLEVEKAKAFTAMYDLTFVSEKSFLEHISAIAA